jgi:hypothetical protein
MMPGSVEESYDPVWGTGSNAQEVLDAISEVREIVAGDIGSPPKYILDVIRQKDDHDVQRDYLFTERELRIIRFCLSVALGEEDI